MQCKTSGCRILLSLLDLTRTIKCGMQKSCISCGLKSIDLLRAILFKERLMKLYPLHHDLPITPLAQLPSSKRPCNRQGITEGDGATARVTCRGRGRGPRRRGVSGDSSRCCLCFPSVGLLVRCCMAGCSMLSGSLHLVGLTEM